MKKFFEISFDIYPKGKILETIKIFKEITNIWFEKNKLFIEWENEDEIEEIFLEFWNYVIWLINN